MIPLPPLPPLMFHVEVMNPAVFDQTYDGDRIMRALRAGTLAVANEIKRLWIRNAQERHNLHSSGAYVRGIHAEGVISVDYEREVLDPREDLGANDVGFYEIGVSITNTCEHASIVEEGHGAFHLPSVVNWSRGRVKFTKDGRPYRSIPFEHTAYVREGAREPSGMTTRALSRMMPKEIHAQAKGLRYRAKRNAGLQYDAQGRYRAADKYHWPRGGTGYGAQRGPHRLDRRHVTPSIRLGTRSHLHGYNEHVGEEMRGARLIGNTAEGPLINPGWSASKYHGMFKTGSPGHTQYMTIRTMTPDSKGWNIPAQAGRWIAREVAIAVGSSQTIQEIFVGSVSDSILGPSA